MRRLAPCVALALLLQAPTVLGDSTDAGDMVQLDGTLDERQLDATVSRHWQVAIATLTPAIDSGRLNDAELVEALARRAGAYFMIGQVDLALSDCDRGLSIAPRHGPLLLRRAIVAIDKREFGTAGRDLDAAIAGFGLSSRERAFALFSRAMARYQLHDAGGGAADLEAAQAEDPALLAELRDFYQMQDRISRYRQAVKRFDAPI